MHEINKSKHIDLKPQICFHQFLLYIIIYKFLYFNYLFAIVQCRQYYGNLFQGVPFKIRAGIPSLNATIKLRWKTVQENGKRVYIENINFYNTCQTKGYREKCAKIILIYNLFHYNISINVKILSSPPGRARLPKFSSPKTQIGGISGTFLFQKFQKNS